MWMRTWMWVHPRMSTASFPGPTAASVGRSLAATTSYTLALLFFFAGFRSQAASLLSVFQNLKVEPCFFLPASPHSRSMDVWIGHLTGLAGEWWCSYQEGRMRTKRSRPSPAAENSAAGESKMIAGATGCKQDGMAMNKCYARSVCPGQGMQRIPDGSQLIFFLSVAHVHSAGSSLRS